MRLERRRLSLSALLALACLATLLGSCGSKPPSIVAVEWRIESRPESSGGRYESLSAFASVKDEAGIDNISELWVVNDEACLAWKLTDADWTKSSSGSDTWLGAASLATPELGGLPRGGYRMIAIDAAGSQAELGFSVSGDFPSRPAPSLSYSGGKIIVASSWPETLVLAFDSAGTLVGSYPAPSSASSLEAVTGADIAQRTAAVSAYGYDPALKMGAFSLRTKTR